jgi:hypothetical protein
MTRSSSRPDARPLVRLDLLLTSALALMLTALPLGLSTEGPSLSWHAAFARDGGGGNGAGGGGNGQSSGQGGERGRDASQRGGSDRGPGSRGHAYGHDIGRGGQAGGPNGYHDLNEFVDGMRSGRAVGLEQRDERIDQARGRYGAALGKANRDKKAGHGFNSNDEIGPAAHRFSPEETRALMERGWKGPARTAGFRNHGERVRTMVELSKRLGYGAHIGALQTNFGTPHENSIAALQAQLAEAQAAGNQAEVERLEAELAEAIQKAKPGKGPDDSWATADLDVNDDGAVDERDLEALEQSEAGAGAAGEAPAS